MKVADALLQQQQPPGDKSDLPDTLCMTSALCMAVNRGLTYLGHCPVHLECQWHAAVKATLHDHVGPSLPSDCNPHNTSYYQMPSSLRSGAI